MSHYPRAGGVGEARSRLHCVRATSRNPSAQIPDWRKLRVPVQRGLLRSQMRALNGYTRVLVTPAD